MNIISQSSNLFHTFAQSPVKTRKSSISKMSTAFCPSQYSSPYSPVRRQIDDVDLMKWVTPFSPSMQSKTSQDNNFSDRFIPSRKMSKKDSLVSNQQQQQNDQNQPINSHTSSNITVAEAYKKLIVNPNFSLNTQSLIQSFSYQNTFKYSNNSNNFNQGLIPNLKKKNSFSFVDQLSASNNKKRKVSKLPCKVLDAPALQDDYYLNLIDWSSQNFLAVGLASSVYLWNGNNSKVTKLCDLSPNNTVTSVTWDPKNPRLSIGTNNGQVQIWDINKMGRVRILNGHQNRVSSQSWSSKFLSTGSRDKSILHRDIRVNSPFVMKLSGHKQEVCGLKWSPDQQQLSSGGNDNKLFIWNQFSQDPILKFNDHVAAVKAVAWSPHQHGLLASGGGTADRTIRFRNTLTGQTINTIDAGSQVCNLMFSRNCSQLVSTHGYSLNQINIWKYPKMQKCATLTGHTFRVLYLAMSPDGTTIVTGAGDETLRFWNVFPSKTQGQKKQSNLLNIQNIMLR